MRSEEAPSHNTTSCYPLSTGYCYLISVYSPTNLHRFRGSCRFFPMSITNAPMDLRARNTMLREYPASAAARITSAGCPEPNIPPLPSVV